MNVKELAELLGCKIVCGESGAHKNVSGCYIGDLLSLAISKVQKDNVWITIQTNINIAAVASLTEAGCILICDGFAPDKNTAAKADTEEIPILSSEESAYRLAALLSENGI